MLAKEAMSGKNFDTWPLFIHGNVAVSRWTHPQRSARVYLIARGNGLFSRCSEHFSSDEFEGCWISDDIGASVYDSEETAVSEIHFAYPWPLQVTREERASGD
jgi:hypothetical protein